MLQHTNQNDSSTGDKQRPHPPKNLQKIGWPTATQLKNEKCSAFHFSASLCQNYCIPLRFQNSQWSFSYKNNKWTQAMKTRAGWMPRMHRVYRGSVLIISTDVRQTDCDSFNLEGIGEMKTRALTESCCRETTPNYCCLTQLNKPCIWLMWVMQA